MKLRHGALSLDLPDGWEDQSQVIGVGPEDSGFRPNVVLTFAALEKGESLGKLAAKTWPSMEKVLPGLKRGKEGPALLGERPVFQREHTFEMEGRPLAQLQTFIAAGDRALVLTYTHLEARFDAQARAQARQIFESLVSDDHSGSHR
jgi:hypothetical protein